MQAEDQAWLNILQEVEDLMDPVYLLQQHNHVQFNLEEVHFLDVHNQPIMLFPAPEVQEKKDPEPEVQFILENSTPEVQEKKDPEPEVQFILENSTPEVQFLREAPPNRFALKIRRRPEIRVIDDEPEVAFEKVILGPQVTPVKFTREVKVTLVNGTKLKFKSLRR